MCCSVDTCQCPKHNQGINQNSWIISVSNVSAAVLFAKPVWYTVRYSSRELFHQSFVTGEATVGLLKVREGWACQAVRLSASLWFSKTSVNHKAFFPSGAATLLYLLPSRGAAHSCCCSDLIVQFGMTGFHLQLAPGSAHLIPSVRSFTW